MLASGLSCVTIPGNDRVAHLRNIASSQTQMHAQVTPKPAMAPTKVGMPTERTPPEPPAALLPSAGWCRSMSWSTIGISESPCAQQERLETLDTRETKLRVGVVGVAANRAEADPGEGRQFDTVPPLLCRLEPGVPSRGCAAAGREEDQIIRQVAQARDGHHHEAPARRGQQHRREEAIQHAQPCAAQDDAAEPRPPPLQLLAADERVAEVQNQQPGEEPRRPRVDAVAGGWRVGAEVWRDAAPHEDVQQRAEAKGEAEERHAQPCLRDANSSHLLCKKGMGWAGARRHLSRRKPRMPVPCRTCLSKEPGVKSPLMKKNSAMK